MATATVVKRFFSFDDCMNTIIMLSNSQGFYGRLLRDIQELNEDEIEELKEYWESKKFENTVDFILFIEG